uniref:CCT domain-containing protein n=1 Tax=Tanacetum cinerariifolium TaxID=118510 RepID=A0A6L2M9T1_TANCI|nr:CCT domain-containing protein [Tanacetum cinerariifolium]
MWRMLKPMRKSRMVYAILPSQRNVGSCSPLGISLEATKADIIQSNSNGTLVQRSNGSDNMRSTTNNAFTTKPDDKPLPNNSTVVAHKTHTTLESLVPSTTEVEGGKIESDNGVAKNDNGVPKKDNGVVIKCNDGDRSGSGSGRGSGVDQERLSQHQNTTAFKEVAIIRHPRLGEYAFGFITSSVVLQVNKSSAGEASTVAAAPKYVNAAIDTTVIGFKGRSPGCIFTLTACTLDLGHGCIFTLTETAKWECSSYGRALALHARGTGFNSPHFLIFSLCD